MSGLDRVEIEWATANDIEGAIAVLCEIADFRKSLGQDRWKKDWFTPVALQGWIDARQLVVARLEGKVIGTMLLEDEDPIFWPDDPPGEALYVHRLTRTRTGAGAKGLAQRFLAFAQEEAGRRGRAYVRLDCALDETLCAIYDRAGFTRQKGVWEVAPDFHSWCWEKAVSAV